MRIAIPIRFNWTYVAIYIAVVFTGQILEGTNFIFAVLCALYVALWALAYNLSGGIDYPSGAFILSNGLFSVVIGFGAKVLLLQPGDRNLLVPVKTVLIYTVGMVMTVIVVFLTKELRAKNGLLRPFDSLEQLKRAAIGCLVVGLGLTFIMSRTSAGEGTLLSALNQLNSFVIVAILFGTAYEIEHSKGKRSTNWVVIAAIAVSVAQGLIIFSKEGMLIGFVAWGITASLSGYSFKRGQVISLTLGFAFMTYYLVPYSQYVRNYGAKTGSTLDNLPIALHYLGELGETRRLYYEAIEDFSITEEPHLYDQREGFLDRLIQVAMDDALIDHTDKGNVFGLAPTYAAYANIVPHFIWRDKPTVSSGNIYAHELGILADEDSTTGISLSAAADAYHQASWLGVLLLLPIDLLIVFLIMDSVVGSSKYSPFALFPIIKLFEGGAAAGLEICAYLATYGVAGILLVAFVSKVATPFVFKILKLGAVAPQPNTASTPPAVELPL